MVCEQQCVLGVSVANLAAVQQAFLDVAVFRKESVATPCVVYKL